MTQDWAVGSAGRCVGLDDRIDMRGQTTFACDLYRAVAEHFNGIPALAGLAPVYRNDRSFGVVAERLIDLVSN